MHDSIMAAYSRNDITSWPTDRQTEANTFILGVDIDAFLNEIHHDRNHIIGACYH